MTNTAYTAIVSTGVEYAAVSTLTDAFTEESLDSSRWSYINSGSPTSTASTAGSGLQVSIAATTGFTLGGITSCAPVCLANGSFAVSITVSSTVETAGDKLGASVIFSVAQDNTDDAIGMQIAEDTLNGWYSVSGTESGIFSVTYDASTMAWLRIRETGGTIYLETSSDGSTWTTRGSVADHTNINVNSLYAQLNGYGWGSDVAGSATFNSVIGTGGGTASSTSPIVNVTAVIVSPDNDIVASPGSGLPDLIAASFSYGASDQDIRDAVQSAIRSAAGDNTVDIAFVTG